MTDTKKPKTWGELPEEIREALSSEETIGRIGTLAAKQGLPPMEQAFLVRICANLMKGILAPSEFVATIADELDISHEKAAILAGEVNREIFSPVKEALRVVHSRVGGIVKLDPSLVTCLPAQMSKSAALGNKVPGNAPVGNILEQKLAGSFRMKGDTVATTGVPNPKLVVPPPPLRDLPSIPPGQSGVPASDPYRQHDL